MKFDVIISGCVNFRITLSEIGSTDVNQVERGSLGTSCAECEDDVKVGDDTEHSDLERHAQKDFEESGLYE